MTKSNQVLQKKVARIWKYTSWLKRPITEQSYNDLKNALVEKKTPLLSFPSNSAKLQILTDNMPSNEESDFTENKKNLGAEARDQRARDVAAGKTVLGAKIESTEPGQQPI